MSFLSLVGMGEACPDVRVAAPGIVGVEVLRDLHGSLAGAAAHAPYRPPSGTGSAGNPSGGRRHRVPCS